VEAAEAAVVAALGVLAATVVFDFALGPLGVLAACVLSVGCFAAFLTGVVVVTSSFLARGLAFALDFGFSTDCPVIAEAFAVFGLG